MLVVLMAAAMNKLISPLSVFSNRPIQGEVRPLSRSNRSRSNGHFRPHEYREANSMMDAYDRKSEQRQTLPQYMSPEPGARRGQYPEEYYNSDLQRLGKHPHVSSSVTQLPVLTNPDLQKLIPNLKKQQQVVTRINKQAKLLEDLVKKLQKPAEKEKEKESVNFENKLKEFEQNLQLKATLTKQQEQIDKMELMNLIGRNVKPEAAYEKKKSPQKPNVTMQLMREQMLAQQNQFLQTMWFMEMMKQNQPPPMPWQMDYNPYPMVMPFNFQQPRPR